MTSTVPSQQKALLLPEKQGHFVVGVIDVPKLGPGEVLVRAEAVGLNPVDGFVQATGQFATEYPAVLGWEAAGTVVQLGEGVTSVSIGDKVLHPGAIGNAISTFKQYNVIAADLTAKIPSNITVDQAAAIPLCLDTAALGLYAEPGVSGGAGLTPPWEDGGRDKYAGQPILVFGGSSSVGQYVIQLAKLSGFSPIITTASMNHTGYLKSLGATHIVDRNAPLSSIPTTVKDITKEPLRIIYAAIATPDIQNAAYELLALDGTLVVVIGNLVEESKRIPTKHIADILGSVFIPDKRQLGVELYKHITAFFASGELKPNHIEVLPRGFSGIPEGLERLNNHEVHALKLVARPQETV